MTCEFVMIDCPVEVSSDGKGLADSNLPGYHNACLFIPIPQSTFCNVKRVNGISSLNAKYLHVVSSNGLDVGLVVSCVVNKIKISTISRVVSVVLFVML